MKRKTGTLIWATTPYLGWTFVALDPIAPLASVDSRTLFLLCTAAVALLAFTYPGWDD